MNAPITAPNGQRRKFWAWGYEGQEISESDIKSMQQRVAQRLGMSEFTALKDPTLDEIEIRAPRIKPPPSLVTPSNGMAFGSICRRGRIVTLIVASRFSSSMLTTRRCAR